MAVDRTRLPQPTRLVLLEQFEQRTDEWRDDVDDAVKTLVSRLDVMGAKLGVYAALGSLLGGGIVAAVAAAVFH